VKTEADSAPDLTVVGLSETFVVVVSLLTAKENLADDVDPAKFPLA
jgi:hypothetical protein